MEDVIHVPPEDVTILDDADYCAEVSAHFTDVPKVAKPLLKKAQCTLNKIEQLLYSAPSFIDTIRALVPETSLQAVLSDKQKLQLATGSVRLMTKKDGSLMATLVDTSTNKIVSTIPLKEVKLSPEILESMSQYTTQMQLAEIAEQLQLVQHAIEEVRQGQEYDRLATAYSCQQKFLQAMSIKNPELKQIALLRIVSDAEDSRNLLMLSQSANLEFIKNQPESYLKKLLFGDDADKINARMAEIRESLNAVNMVSLTEALAYQEMGETEAAQVCLQYYGDYIQKNYLYSHSFIRRLDELDPSPEQYWSKTLPKVQEQIRALPCNISAQAALEE